MSDASIKVHNVSLDFQLRSPSILDFIKKRRKEPNHHREKSTTFSAVKDLNFVLQRGDRVGIIGRNGAGKSTLLKLLAGVLAPSRGQLEITGETFPLLDLSADIVQQATCLQNIRLRGLLMGLKGSELEAYINRVREMADIDRFLYSPVSTLSTGMKTRFLVSLIGDYEPEILIMDEWIGTTDSSFTDQNTSQMHRLVEHADIFVLATHNRALLKKYCNKVLLLEQGELVFVGDVADGFKQFNQLLKSD